MSYFFYDQDNNQKEYTLKINFTRNHMVIAIATVITASGIVAALVYANFSNNKETAGTTIPNAQQPSGHNTSPATSPCQNDAPPLALNIGGNTVEACNQPVAGTVTAISASNISVQSSDDNSIHVFTISSDTQITHHGQKITTGDIKIGDTVSLIPSNTDANGAWYILVNPSFQGAQ